MDYQLIDADEHYYEPDDCFSRHIEARFKDQTISVRRGADGLGRIFLRGRRTFMSVMPGDYASAPGALEGLFAGEVADGFTHREVINAKDHPAFTEKAARLALMDGQSVEATIMLPTLGVAVEYDMRDDVELTYASLRAFNRWLEEDWGARSWRSGPRPGRSPFAWRVRSPARPQAPARRTRLRGRP
jgi:hypothetical protein